MNANRLKLNHDKTEVIVIGTPAKVSAIKTRTVELCGELINIRPTSSVINLGAHLDSNLSMDQNILQLRKTCYLELRRIAQIQQYLTVESANSSDHGTVFTKLKLSLRVPKHTKKSRYNWPRFSHLLTEADIQANYTMIVKNKFQMLDDEGNSGKSGFVEANRYLVLVIMSGDPGGGGGSADGDVEFSLMYM
ncbi:Non-LTR (Long terminal repeat) retrotransposon and domain-containing protein, partial [Elysia marginata]